MRPPPLLLGLLLAAPVLAQPAPQRAPEAALPHLEAGFGNDWFFLRSSDDDFIFIPSGRLQMDFIGGQAGVPAATFLPKRARLEAFGTLLHHFDFQAGAEFTFSGQPVSTDNFVVANFTRYAELQVGQFDAPFTMDNRTSDRYSDLQERSSAVRAFAIPENKMTGAMVWGQPESRRAYWSAGLFNGDGINAYPNKDAYFDFLGRAWIAPLPGALEHVWLGGSYWNGFHKPTAANQVDLTAMKDAAGFTFFGPRGVGLYGQVTKWGLELNAPVGPFVLKAEYIHGDEGLREVAAGAAKRRSRLTGDACYARVSWFAFGDPLINGLGGSQLPPHLFGALAPGKKGDALQLIAQYDRVGSTYAADDGAGTAGDPLVGDYNLDTFTLGANYWYTKHVRLTGNLIFNTFGGQSPRPLAGRDGNLEVTLRLAVAL